MHSSSKEWQQRDVRSGINGIFGGLGINSSSTQQIKLKNGLSATIRVITPDDKEKIITAFSKLEAETTYTRFFSYKKALSEAELDKAHAVPHNSF